jgi:hypothetical protein
MTDEQFDEYLKTRYQAEMDWYEMRSKRNKMLYLFFQWGIIILSAITPILITIGDFRGAPTQATGNPQEITGIQIFSISTAFLVAVFAAATKVFHFQENWLDFRATREELKSEIHLYSARLYGYATARDTRALFVNRIESIIRREVRVWEFRMKPEGTVKEESEVDDTATIQSSAKSKT